MGVFYREVKETVGDFITRVEAANWPPRSLEELTDDELEQSLASIQPLMGKMHPEHRVNLEQYQTTEMHE